MKELKSGLLILPFLGAVFLLAFTGGSIERGKILFNEPNFGGSTNEKKCGSCHPGGQGLEKACAKKAIELFGQTVNSLENAVNLCITMPLEGTAIKKDSQDMKDIVAYICSLEKKPPGRRKRRAPIVPEIMLEE